jgi:hypothetical protein
MTQDEMLKEERETFGENTWVYCDQHMRPHLTGWCTVGVRNKTKLNFTPSGDHQEDCKAAVAECRARGFELYADFVAERQKNGSAL